jgi:hypothetical protein
LSLVVRHLPEPLLEFGYGQCIEAPKDGLFLFGPIEGSTGRNQVRLGAIGTNTGLALLRNWLSRLRGSIPGKVDKQGHDVLWAPAWPGFEACFGISLPERPLAEIELSKVDIEAAIKKSNRADAVRTTVKLFEERINHYRNAEERQPDVWIVVVPDVVYRYGRPKVSGPPVAERTSSDIVSRKGAARLFKSGDLFPETFKDADTYLFSMNFHHQLKAELLRSQVVLQLIRESTLEDRAITPNSRQSRGLQDEASIAWNFSTTLYFKTDAKPWALAGVRPDVCYVGLVFKHTDLPVKRGEACCAAQMFLNSGDGVVFKGALGPWYSDKTREYHLSKEAAENLMESVVSGYHAKHGRAPSELFIHGRHRFNQDEWEGFRAAAPEVTALFGIRIRTADDMRLFRPDSSTPVLRGTAAQVDQRQAFLWARGFVPRLAQYQGFETPKPLTVDVTHGDAEIVQVMTDVLALTKINYNACDYSSGLPVTLKFADRVGDILLASPRISESAPLPFRFYI